MSSSSSLREARIDSCQIQRFCFRYDFQFFFFFHLAVRCHVCHWRRRRKLGSTIEGSQQQRAAEQGGNVAVALIFGRSKDCGFFGAQKGDDVLESRQTGVKSGRRRLKSVQQQRRCRKSTVSTRRNELQNEPHVKRQTTNKNVTTSCKIKLAKPPSRVTLYRASRHFRAFNATYKPVFFCGFFNQANNYSPKTNLQTMQIPRVSWAFESLERDESNKSSSSFQTCNHQIGHLHL